MEIFEMVEMYKKEVLSLSDQEKHDALLLNDRELKNKIYCCVTGFVKGTKVRISENQPFPLFQLRNILIAISIDNYFGIFLSELKNKIKNISVNFRGDKIVYS